MQGKLRLCSNLKGKMTRSQILRKETFGHLKMYFFFITCIDLSVRTITTISNQQCLTRAHTVLFPLSDYPVNVHECERVVLPDSVSY